MPISPEVVAKRKEVIIEALRTPMTYSQLRLTLLDEFEITYPSSTMRRDLRELKDSGIIQYTGSMLGREPVYQTGTKFNMPRIYNPLRGESYLPTEIQEWIANGSGIMSTDHFLILEKTISRLLNDARKMADGSATDVQSDLDYLKANCTKSLNVLLTYSKMIEQLLSQKVWWSSQSIANVTEDVSFDAQKVWANDGKVD